MFQGLNFKCLWCNQLLPEFSCDQYETLHRCNWHIESVNDFVHENIIFDKILLIFDLDNFFRLKAPI